MVLEVKNQIYVLLDKSTKVIPFWSAKRNRKTDEPESGSVDHPVKKTMARTTQAVLFFYKIYKYKNKTETEPLIVFLDVAQPGHFPKFDRGTELDKYGPINHRSSRSSSKLRNTSRLRHVKTTI